MVEIISAPDSPIILAIAVTKFGRRSSITGLQILEQWSGIALF